MTLLLYIVSRIHQIVIDPCMIDGDPYSLQSRKLFVIAFSAISFNALFLGVPLVVLNSIYDPTVGGYIAGATYFQVATTASIVPYVYLRITKTLPQWVPDLQIWSTIPVTLAFNLVSHQGSVIVITGTVSLVGIILQIRGWFAMLMYSIGIIIFHALINDFADEIPILHETFYSTQILPCKAIYLLGTVVTPLLLLGLGLWYIMNRFSERMDQADAAIAMNLAVADKLRRYDTEGVAEILAANQGKVDENLLEAFTAIQYNLQEYRPHIPDYVIEATIADLLIDDAMGGGGGVIKKMDGADVSTKDDEDEGDQTFEMSESQQSIRLIPNQNASFCGSYSSTGNNNPVHNNDSSNNVNQGYSPDDPRGIQPQRVPEENGEDHSSITLDSSMTRSVPLTLSPKTSSILVMPRMSSGGSHNMVSGAIINSCGSHQNNNNNRLRHHSLSKRGSELLVPGGEQVINVSASMAPPKDNELTTTTSSSNPPQGPQHHILEKYAAADSRRRQSTTMATSEGEMNSMPHNGRGKGGMAKTYSGRATTVFIRFIASECGSVRGTDGSVPRGINPTTVVDILGVGVEAASKMAKAYGGALQYVQGCGLMVSFNAASRVAAHEAKACAFALGVQGELEGLRRTPLTMHATIVTSTIMSFFAGNGGQLMLTVLGGYMPIHTALHHYLSQTVGDDVSCILISKSTLPNIELHYESRILGAVSMTSRQEGVHVKSFNVHTDAIQLVCSRKATGSDEWMYELENQTSTHAFTKKVVDTAISGDFFGAMRIVTEHETAIHNDTLLSRCLHDRIKSCIEDSTAFPLHTARPTKMW